MIWVTAEDVVAIHSRIIQVSGGIDGLLFGSGGNSHPAPEKLNQY